jgi:hypothetical protein
MGKLTSIYDGRLYFYFTLVTLVIALALGATSYYSILFVEPEIARHLDAAENIEENYARAYKRLADPQIFARYENFDDGGRIKNIMIDFDKKIGSGGKFIRDDRVYLEVLLERRKMGSLLGRNTMAFFFLLALLGAGFFVFEKIKFEREGES